jgi:hypothetical protein
VTAKSVQVVHIAKRAISGGYNGPTYAKVVPVKDSFIEKYGGGKPKPMTKRVKYGYSGYSVAISDYEHAYLWNGEAGTDSGDH